MFKKRDDGLIYTQLGFVLYKLNPRVWTLFLKSRVNKFCDLLQEPRSRNASCCSSSLFNVSIAGDDWRWLLHKVVCECVCVCTDWQEVIESLISVYSIWFLSSSCRDIQTKVMTTWYVLLPVRLLRTAFCLLSSGGLWYPLSLISVLLLAFSWATIVCLCYWKSLVQLDNRFSRSSWGELQLLAGLRAASSETGSEQDSASLTEREREEEGRVMFIRGQRRNIFICEEEFRWKNYIWRQERGWNVWRACRGWLNEGQTCTG